MTTDSVVGASAVVFAVTVLVFFNIGATPREMLIAGGMVSVLFAAWYAKHLHYKSMERVVRVEMEAGVYDQDDE